MEITRTGHRYIDAESNITLDAWFPASQQKLRRACLAEKHGFVKGDFIEATIRSLDEPPVSTEDACLRLHLLSERSVVPNQVNLHLRAAADRRLDFRRARRSFEARGTARRCRESSGETARQAQSKSCPQAASNGAA